MLEVPSIVALRRLRESVVSSDEDAYAPLAELPIDRRCRVDDALHLSSNFRIAPKTELLALIKRAVDDPDCRPNEDPVLCRLQHVDRFFVCRLAVINHVHATTNSS